LGKKKKTLHRKGLVEWLKGPELKFQYWKKRKKIHLEKKLVSLVLLES
jgi:hypothetical protein